MEQEAGAERNTNTGLHMFVCFELCHLKQRQLRGAPLPRDLLQSLLELKKFDISCQVFQRLPFPQPAFLAKNAQMQVSSDCFCGNNFQQLRVFLVLSQYVSQIEEQVVALHVLPLQTGRLNLVKRK